MSSDELDRRRQLAPVVRAVSDIAAAALRLAHCAPDARLRRRNEITGRIDRGLQRAVRALGDVAFAGAARVPIVIKQARRATIALTRATAATANDLMLVPGQLAAGLRRLLAVCLIATEMAAA